MKKINTTLQLITPNIFSPITIEILHTIVRENIGYKKITNIFQKGKEISMFNNAKEKISKIKSGVNSKCALASAYLITTLTSITGHADVNSVDPDVLVKTLIDYVFKIFQYIGVILLAWSIGSLVLAFKDENADGKSRAIMVLVVSVLLISVGTIFDALNLM